MSLSTPISLLESFFMLITADMGQKVKGMQAFIEEDCDPPPARKEISYKRRTDLQQLVKELGRSYCGLTENIDHFKSESTQNSRGIKHIRSTRGSFDDSKLTGCDFHSQRDAGYRVGRHSISSFMSVDTLADKFMSTELRKMRLEDRTTDFSDKDDTLEKRNGYKLCENEIGDPQMGHVDWKNNCSEVKFQVTKLVEDNLQQQDELIKRNDNKRETIKELRYQLHLLRDENRALQKCLGCIANAKQKQTWISKFRLLLGRLWAQIGKDSIIINYDQSDMAVNKDCTYD
ncbi:hypothetical protein RJ639_042185 [Escallonia herrerae]|uniref:NAB domain-containing protein n=1 Tax=Escallonia herrerae TaxID=1293975 RepID=A0AA89B6U5_9ASTE|nr:hypothetical protein RJ639_042185 [Escallonia herrerae]